MKKNNLLRFFVLVSVLFVFLGFTCSCSQEQEYKVVKVIKGPFYMKVHAIGQLKSTNSTHIGPPNVADLWNYTIASMIPEGTEVKPGEVILAFNAKELMEKWQLKKSELDTIIQELEKNRLVEQEAYENFLLQVSEMRVQREKAAQKANQPEEFTALNEVKKLRMELELAQLQESLALKRLSNQKTGMFTRIRVLENKRKRLENEVNDLQRNIAKMRIKAPRAGVVVYATDWRGRKKNVGDSVWVGAQVMEVPDLSQMEVAAVIPEPLAGKIKIAQDAEIRLDANPDKVYRGKVKSLGSIFRTKSSEQPAIVFDAILSVLDPNPEQMRPGMAASVDIIIAAKQNVLQIPESALVYDEKGLFVLKKKWSGTTRIPITIGARSADMVEVLSGLSENEEIITRNGEAEK